MPRYIERDGKLLGRSHLYRFDNVLRPRGGKCRKESVSLLLSDWLWAAYEDWTDPEYADSKNPADVARQIEANLEQEIRFALDDFRERVEGGSDAR